MSDKILKILMVVYCIVALFVAFGIAHIATHFVAKYW